MMKWRSVRHTGFGTIRHYRPRHSAAVLKTGRGASCWSRCFYTPAGALHELGHILHAWVSGGTVAAVQVPLVGFSITRYSTNPHAHFVAWGGAVWGSLLPLLTWFALARRQWLWWHLVQFFAGFCLIANGVYLGVGWTQRAGDAADLVRYGTPVWVLVGFGILTTGLGLHLWHRLGTGP
jgi:hypothetical protein